MSDQSLPQCARGDVPQFAGIIGAPACKRLAVRCKLNRVYGVGMRFNRRRTTERFSLPDPETTCCFTGRQMLAGRRPSECPDPVPLRKTLDQIEAAGIPDADTAASASCPRRVYRLAKGTRRSSGVDPYSR